LFDLVWLVVLTILKNISQWEGLSNHQPPKWNMEKKHVPNHQAVVIHNLIYPSLVSLSWTGDLE
jgi:hypothetical protein